ESCVARAFRGISIHTEPDAFIRPAAATVAFDVADDGSITVSDERWLELIKLEEAAERERKRAELMGDAGEVEPDRLELPEGGDDMGEGSGSGSAVTTGKVEVPTGGSLDLGPRPGQDDGGEAVEGPQDDAEEQAPTGDPSKPGVKIDLSPGRRVNRGR
ncbi:MAG: hypothetical protein KC457_27520, partial [Myxococcales bacterium]|nr:hypothetical protein [Myxococcales bacterium]